MPLFLPRFFMPSFLPQKIMLNIVYHDFTFSRNSGISNVFFSCRWHYRNPDQKSPKWHRSHRLRIWQIGRFFFGRPRESWQMSSKTTSTAEHLHICLLTLDGKFMQKMHRNDVTCVAVILLLRQKTIFLKSLLFKIARRNSYGENEFSPFSYRMSKKVAFFSQMY